jgi:epoxyqueuosine reductase
MHINTWEKQKAVPSTGCLNNKNMPDIQEKMTRLIRDKAAALGFDACGIAPAGKMDREAEILKNWLSANMHASMKYMERHAEKRNDPALLSRSVRSVVMLAMNYFPAEQALHATAFRFSKYAFGNDYHTVIKNKLKILLREIENEAGPVRAKLFTDTAPVFEKAWAARCGLGWIGKNACFINKRLGSFLFLGGIMLDLELVYDQAATTNYCGTCTRCMEACPNKAIIAPGMIDASKCISYLTIEHRGPFTGSNDRLHSWVFGCDICQDVCPWNRFAKAHSNDELKPRERFLSMGDHDWQSLNRDTFNELFSGTAVERTGYDGLRRNIGQVMRENKMK